jgi:hypothetical protein
MGHIKMTAVGKGKIILFGILLFGIGCTIAKEKSESDQIIEINFENSSETYSGQTINIGSSTVIEIFANDLEYNEYERENAKQEYYNLTDFQGYYSEIVTPIVDSLNIARIRLADQGTRLNFKTKNGDTHIVDIRKIQSKQGLILFNGKSEPVFWKGDKSSELDIFVHNYFK